MPSITIKGGSTTLNVFASEKKLITRCINLCTDLRNAASPVQEEAAEVVESLTKLVEAIATRSEC